MERDAQLIARIAAGDLEALGNLFDTHQEAVRGYVARLGLLRGDCDDITQSVFLEVVRSAQRFDPKYAARAWLLGIATMLVRRHRRSFVRQTARLLRWSNEPPRPSEPSPEERYRGDCAQRRFNEAYEKLSLKKREVFSLVVLEGLSGEEAAQALSIPIGTVWTRLHHARKELRGAVEEGGS